MSVKDTSDMEEYRQSATIRKMAEAVRKNYMERKEIEEEIKRLSDYERDIIKKYEKAFKRNKFKI